MSDEPTTKPTPDDKMGGGTTEAPPATPVDVGAQEDAAKDRTGGGYD